MRGSAVVEQDYVYALDSTNSGFLDTRTNFGGATTRFSTTVTDWIGRSTSVLHPEFGGSANFTQTNKYDGNGYLGHLTEVDMTGYSPLKKQYDPMGNLVLSGMDLSNDNLALASNDDQMAATNQYFESYTPPTGNAGYWLHQESDIYPTEGSGTAVPTKIVRTRLTNFPANELAESWTTDIYGNTADRIVTVDTASLKITVTTTVTGSSNSQVDTITNGLRQSTTGLDDALRQTLVTTD